MAGAACMTAGLLLAACSSSSPSTSTSASAAGGEFPATAPGSAVLGPQNGTAAPAPDANQRGTVRLTRIVPTGRSIVFTADITLRVPDVTAAATAATGIVAAVGGYVSSEHETVPPNGQGTAQATLDLKIPVGLYEPTLTKLATLGRGVSFDQQAEDVTQQVADVGSRVASAQAAIRQLRALLRRAGSISDLLTVQNEINTQESALESLLAQQQALSHATSYATVSALLLGHHAAVVKKAKKRPHGFGAGLRSGWHALAAVVTWLLTALGALLPFAVPLALIGGLAEAGRRRLARRRTPPAQAPPAAAAS